VITVNPLYFSILTSNVQHFKVLINGVKKVLLYVF